MNTCLNRDCSKWNCVEELGSHSEPLLNPGPLPLLTAASSIFTSAPWLFSNRLCYSAKYFHSTVSPNGWPVLGPEMRWDLFKPEQGGSVLLQWCRGLALPGKSLCEPARSLIPTLHRTGQLWEAGVPAGNSTNAWRSATAEGVMNFSVRVLSLLSRPALNKVLLL